jgi:putative membrane protein
MLPRRETIASSSRDHESHFRNELHLLLGLIIMENVAELMFSSLARVRRGGAPSGQQQKGDHARPGAVVVAITSILGSPAAAQGAANLIDAQIVHFVQTAGQIDIEGAKQALSKSANKAVRSFAEGLVHDNTVVNKRTADLIHKVKVTSEDNDLSRALNEHAAYKRAELAKLKGAEFDKACIANEAAYHLTVNGALEVTLIPSATNPELKSLLQSGLRIFQGHQQHAKEVASALK